MHNIIIQDLRGFYTQTLPLSTSEVVCLQRPTWHSNPLLLVDEGVYGHDVKGSIDEWAEPGHGFIPVAVTEKTLLIRVDFCRYRG